MLSALALASCFGDGTGPGELRLASVSVAPQFDRNALLAVDVNRVLIRFTLPGTATVAYDTVVDFPASTDTLNLNIRVPVSGTSQQFDMTLLMIDDPAADTVFRAGPILVTATVGTPSTVATPPLIYVGVGANAVGVRFVTAPAQVFFGGQVSFVAEAFDGNNVTIANTPLVWRTSDPTRASLPDPTTGTFVGGAARGTATITAGLLVTVAHPVTPPSASVPLVVQPVASALVVQGGSGQTGAVGVALTQPVTVRVNAADGLGVQGVTVNFVVTGGGGSLSAATATTNASGDASVTWTLGPTLGAQAVGATVAGLTGVSVPATGTVGPAVKLGFVQEPTNGTAGFAIAPVVAVAAQDLLGNTVTGYTGTIALAIGANPGGSTLSGTTSAAAVAGVATFTGLALSNPGAGYTLVASATGLTAATSAAFNMISNAPAQLAFVVQPTQAFGGATITPPVQVEIRNAGGALVTSATNTVTMAIANNPGGGTLSGTVSVAAVAGVATFSGLSIDLSGTGYTLSATSTGLAAATSTAFDIIGGTPQTLQFTVPPGLGNAGGALTPAPAVRVRDALGNTVTSFTGNVTLALGANPGGATLSGTLTVAAVAGIATFSNVVVSGFASGYTLVASSGALPNVTSTAFDVAPAGTTKTWRGGFAGALTDWNNLNNWQPVGVPGAADNVFVPSSAVNQPVQAAGGSVAALTLTPGATLTITSGNLVTTGSVTSFGTISGAGTLLLNGAGQAVQGALPRTVVNGSVTASGSMTTIGDLVVQGSLAPGGQTILVTGDFSTLGSGVMVMNTAGDVLTVQGNATFAGVGAGAGTVGTFNLGGNFSQVGAGLSYVNGGSFRVVLNGTGAQAISFTNPGAAANRFQHLDIAKTTGTASFTTNVHVAGDLTVTSGALAGAATATVAGNVIVAAGATVAAGGITIGGSLSGAGLAGFAPATTEFAGAGQNIPAAPPYQNMRVSGSASLTGATAIGGTLTIDGPAGSTTLTLNGQTATVGGAFSTANGGVVVFANAADVLDVNGDATFGGSGSGAPASAGTLRIAGNLYQAGTAATFLAQGTHLTVLDGTAAQTVRFDNPGTGTGQSRFHDLQIANTSAAIALQTSIAATGQLRSAAGTETVNGGGNTISVAGLDVDGLVLDNAPLTSTGGTLARLDNVTFQGYPATGVPLTLTHDGAATAFSFANDQWLVTPTSGRYLDVVDANPGDGLVFTINFSGTNPTDGSLQTGTTGGAIVTWPAAAIMRTWTGVVSTDWFDAGNWAPAGIPAAGEDVTIPAGAPNLATLTAPATIRNLTMVTGADLIKNFSLTVTGNMNTGLGNIVGGSFITMTGASATLVGRVGSDLRVAPGANVTLGSGVVTSGGAVNVSGNLTLAGHIMVLTGNLITQGPGTVTMTNAADSLAVGGNAIFSGGDETGKLTAGVIGLQGNFTQAGVTPTSFRSTGTLVRMVQGVPQLVSFSSSGLGQSQFAGLIITKSGGTIDFTQPTPVRDSMVLGSVTTVTGQLIIRGRLVTTAGSTFQANVVIHPDSLFIGGTYDAPLTTFNAGATLPVLTYHAVTVNTGGAVAFAGPVTLSGAGSVLTVSGAGTVLTMAAGTSTLASGITINNSGRLVLNSTTLNAAAVNLSSGGLLTMQNTADVLSVGGAVFGGGDETGHLTAGRIDVSGSSFDQLNNTSPNSFVSTGTRVRLTNGGFQNINFATPGLGASHFHDVEFAVNGGFWSWNQPLFATGQLVVNAGATTLFGNGHAITVAGLDVNGLTLDNSSLISTGGTITQFDNVTLQNYAATATPLVISHPGAAGPFTFTNVQWLVTPSSGHYLDVTDNVADANVLTIDLVGSNPGNGSSQTGGAGGAVVNWPAAAAVRTWAGTTSTNFSDGANWVGGVIPGLGDDVVIPAGAPNQPLLTAPVAVHNLTVAAGGSLDLDVHSIVVSGNVSAAQPIVGAAGSGLLAMTGTNKTLQGDVPGLNIASPVSLIGPSNATQLTVSGAGAMLSLNGHPMTVAGDLLITNSGLLGVSNPADSVTVLGNATFGGGDQTGLLAGGVLVVHGSFTQDNVGSVNSFVSTGTRLRMTGTGTTQTVTFNSSTPTTSRLADLIVESQAGRPVQLGFFTATDSVVIATALTVSADGSGGFMTIGRKLKLVAGSSLSASALRINADSIQNAGSLNLIFYHFTGGTIPAGTYNRVFIEGTAVFAPGPVDMQQFTVTGSGVVATLNGPTTAALFGRVDTGAELILNGHTMVTQQFNAFSAGLLTMTNAADSLEVSTGIDVSSAGNSTGHLTAGVMHLAGGSLTASGANGFISGGTRVRVTGSSTQSVAFAFGNVARHIVVNKSGGTLSFGTATVTDSLVIQSPTTVTGASLTITGRLVTASGSDFQGGVTIHADSMFIGGSYSGGITFSGGASLPVHNYRSVTVSTGAASTFTGPVSLQPGFGLTVNNGTVLTVSGSGVTTSAGGGVNVSNSAELVLNNSTVTTSNFSTASGALLTMTHSVDQLIVTGNVTFNGGDESGHLTDGLISLTGSFTQTATTTPMSFVSTGTRVRFAGTGTQNVLFATPGPGAGASQFAHVELANSGNFSFTQNLFANGQLRSLGGATPVTSNGSTMNVAGLDVDGLTLTNAHIASVGGTIVKFDDITFTGYAVTATPLVISHPGAAGPLTFDNVQWLVTPTTGQYLSVTDDVADANVLTIDLANAAFDGSLLTGTAGGAVVNWQFVSPVRTWTGATSGDWFDPANWSGNAVPTTSNDVVIPAGTPNAISLSAPFSIKGLTVAAGVTLNLGASDVTTAGNVDVQGSIVNGMVRMSGASPVTLVGGPIENVEVRGGDVSAAGNVIIGSVGLDINQANGVFRVGSNTVTIGGHLNVTNGGLLTMTSTGSVVNVTGSVIFGGADESGSLTDGLLTVGGNFSQFASTTPNSFVSTGTVVRFTNTAARTVLFDSPGVGSSHFQQVEVTGSGNLAFATDVFITGDLTMTGGAVLGAGTLNVSGDVNKTSGSLGTDGLTLGGALNYAFGGFGVNTTTFAGTNQVIPVGFIYANVGITGTAVTVSSGTWSIAGGLTVSGGDLTIASGNFATMAGLTVTGGVLNQTGGSITASNVAFGGATSGTLSGGTLTVGGNFTQSGGSTSFAASGSHRVILQGINSTIAFSSPGLALSRFNELELQGTAATLAQNVFAAGQLSGGGGHVLHGNGFTLTATGLDVDGMVFDNALLTSTGGTLASFNNISFQGYASTATPLTISHPGAASPVTFDNVAWLVTPTGPGRYLNLTDDNVGNGLTLALDLSNSSPGDGSPQSTLNNGALVFWPLLANWTGATSTDWSNAANWSGGNLPGSASNAMILPGTPNAPALSAPASVNNLSVATGAAVGLGAHNLTVNGDVAVAGAITASGGNLVMAGTGKTLGGAVPGLLITGTVSAIQPVTINGLVDVSGTFDLGTSVTVNGDFQTTPTGLLSMVNPAAQLTINGNAVFTGLDETALLTQGFIDVTGNFSQQSIGSNMSFASAGTDLRLTGSGAQTVDMQAASPFLSHLAALEISKSGGSVTFSGNILVMDSLLVTSATSIGGAGTLAVFRKIITQAGSALSFDGLSVDPDSLNHGGSYSVVTTVFTNGGLVPALAYDNLVFGPGAYSTTTPLNPASLSVNSAATLTLGADVAAGIVSIVGGELVVNGHTLVASTGLTTLTGGLLTMTNPADSVVVPGAGTIAFDGGDQAGRLTAGVIAVGGHFNQGPTGDSRSFVSTGTRVRFNGTGDQSVSFFNPGFADSHFAGVIVDKASNGLTFTTNAFIIDSLEVASSTDVLGGGTVTVGRKVRTQGAGNFAMGGLTVHADSLLINPLTTYGVATTLFNGGGLIPVLTYGSVTVATASATTLPAMTIGGDLTVSGAGTDLTLAAGTHTINGPVVVEGTGSRLRVNGATATMNSLTTQVEGVLDMTAGGLVLISGNARFDGSDQTGLLTAGTIGVEGDFTQVSTTSARSFVSQGTTVELNGGGTQPVSFQSTLGTDSRFAALHISKAGGNVTLTGNAFVTESLLVNSNTDVDGGNWFVTRKLSTIVGSNFEPASLEMNSDSLFVLGAFDLAQVSTVRFTAGTTIPALGYTNLIVQSGGPMAMTGGALLNASLQVVGSQLTLFNGGTTAVNGAVTVSGAGADLILNGSTLIVNQALSVSAGTLTMTDPADVVIAAGDASFSSANSTGHLTAGDLSVEGNFTATGVLAYVASGAHRTLFQGSLNQVISFSVPGPLTTGSHFQDLKLNGIGGITLATDAYADGVLVDSSNASTESVTGNGVVTLQVGGATVDNMTFANIGIVIDNTATFIKFDNATWTSGPAAGSMLRVQGDGNQTRTFNNLTFPAADPAPVNYLATCWQAGVGTPFTITLVNPSPTQANNFGRVDNSCGAQGTAVTNWP